MPSGSRAASPHERATARLCERLRGTGARSDWEAYKHLASLSQPRFPWCHALHYLQMATEEMAKAYRIRDTQGDAEDLMRHHVGFERFVNSFFSSS